MFYGISAPWYQEFPIEWTAFNCYVLNEEEEEEEDQEENDYCR